MLFLHAHSNKRKSDRRGGAAVELAGFLPILILISMASVDFARLCYVQNVLQNCARNGAVYEFYKKAGFAIPASWTSLTTAVNSDVPTGMTVSASASSPASGSNNTVTVTVTSTYNLLSLGAVGGMNSIPSSMTLSQSATMPYPASATTIP